MLVIIQLGMMSVLQYGAAMRYDAAHKAQSRTRILEAARARFRRHGFAGASIDQVMRDAGLTRGAFYAHFESKDALVRAVLSIEAGLVHDIQQATVTADPASSRPPPKGSRPAGVTTDSPRDAVVAVLARYLDPAEREDVAMGCPLVAHPTDAIRGTSAHRAAYGARVDSLVRALESVASREAATEATLLAVGAALLSAAIDDPVEADRIEAVALSRIEALLE